MVMYVPTQDPPGCSPTEWGEGKTFYLPVRPMLPPSLELRDYQEAAIMAWFDHDCLGILEMATGAGKPSPPWPLPCGCTSANGRWPLIVAAPYQHLVDQWLDVVVGFSFGPQKAYRSRGS